MGSSSTLGAALALAMTLAGISAAKAQSEGADAALGGAILGGAISNAIQRSTTTRQAAPQRRRIDTASRETVRQDQTDLNALGFNTGVPDGAAGPRTRSAYAAFQTSVGLPKTGIITPEERALLRVAAARIAGGDSRDFALGYAAASKGRLQAGAATGTRAVTVAPGDSVLGGLGGGIIAAHRNGTIRRAAATGGDSAQAAGSPQVAVAAAGPPPAPVPQTAALAPRSGPAIPSRRFSGPGQYPPRDYRGYGVLAFKSQQTSYDRLRHQIICEAYLATMLPSRVIAAPKGDQFVTIWPVSSIESADRLNGSDAPLSPLCREALTEYDLPIAAEAIRKARMAGFEDGGVGPFLLGWLPGDGFGSSDALILSLDLSLVASYAQAQALFTEWKRDIESDPALLERGFSLEILRRKIRRWADRHGPGFLALWQG